MPSPWVCAGAAKAPYPRGRYYANGEGCATPRYRTSVPSLEMENTAGSTLAASTSGIERLTQRILDLVRQDMAADRLVLPSLPDMAVRLRPLLDSPSGTAAKVTRVIGKDPALSARLLRVANSAYYPRSGMVRDLRSAVVRLGNRLVRHLSQLLMIAQLYDVKAHPAIKPHLVDLWQHSTMVATISELLASRHAHLSAEEAQLAGLVHDIGVLPVLVRVEKMPQILSEPRVLDPIVTSLHTQIGRRILELWRFPRELMEVAEEHENLERENLGLPDYVDIVTAANLMSHLGSDHRLAAVDWSTVPAMDLLELKREDAEDILRYAGPRVAEFRQLFAVR